MTTAHDQVRDQVRARYAAAATAVATGGQCGCATASAAGAQACCAPAGEASTSTNGCCTSEVHDQDPDTFGAGLYTTDEQDQLPADAVLASLGCGNPLAVADLRPGERVLDLGSGGGIDVLLSAERVGPQGFAYGVDMTGEMLDLARTNAAKAGASNVEFIRGIIEELPLPDNSVDVVISNCVINLSADNPAALAEMHRVLVPGGRIGISDVVAEDQLSDADRLERGSYAGCIAGALSRQEYLDGLTAAGFTDPEVTFTHQVAPDMHAAIIRATKPITTMLQVTPVAQPVTAHAAATMRSTPTASACCSTTEQTSCCDSSAKASCCGTADQPTTSAATSSGTSVAAPVSCGCR